MFSKFKSDVVPLQSIKLDLRNPRIVGSASLENEKDIISYFAKYHDLEDLVHRLGTQGKNPGADKPYIVKAKDDYTVIEGNRRISAYKILTGLSDVPDDFCRTIPKISLEDKTSMLSVECAIAPNRDAVLPIMADTHFGRGDKELWSWLGSRQAILDEYKSGKSIAKIANLFGRKKSEIVDFIMEYKIYEAALSLPWKKEEKTALLHPRMQFNPPIRFLQGEGRKEKVGINLDRTNLSVEFADEGAKRRFKHIIDSYIVHPKKGITATSSYDAVFADYKSSNENPASPSGKNPATASSPGTGSPNTNANGGKPSSSGGGTSSSGDGKAAVKQTKPGRLFSYSPTLENALIRQLMKEAADLSCKSYPGAGHGLLRCLLEALLKEIIHNNKANDEGKAHSLESAIDVCLRSQFMAQDDKRVLKEFKKNHLDTVNMTVHANSKPNFDRLMAARDCVDQFVKRNV